MRDPLEFPEDAWPASWREDRSLVSQALYETFGAGGEWRNPADKLPPAMLEVSMLVNGRQIDGYYNGFSWFDRRGILPAPPMRWLDRSVH